MQTTYSFLDLSGVIAHPLGGTMNFTGLGTGQVTVSMAQERSAIETAADGSVMISKLAGNNGSIQIQCQQTSFVHKFLLELYNKLIIAGPDQWAQAAVLLRNISDGTSHVATGVCFSKIPDKLYTRQGQMITWSLLAGDIQSVTM
jgi:hypothetical protein